VRLAIAAFGAALLFCPVEAMSGPTGEELNARCASARQLDGTASVSPTIAMQAIQCFSFVDGLTIGLRVGALLAESGRSYCPPADFNSTNAIEVIHEFLANYPELSGEDAGVLAADSLTVRYPCSGPSHSQIGELRR
jgi:hypothetical protein